MQRYQTEDEHRKAMRAKINKTIKRGRRRKRIIRRLRKAVPGICIGVLIAGMGAWCIAAPLPDPDDYEPYRFQAENGQWYTQEEYEQMSRERDAYHQREREEAEKEAQMIRDYQEQYQKDQEAEWKLYQEQTRTGLIHHIHHQDPGRWKERPKIRPRAYDPGIRQIPIGQGLRKAAPYR